MNCIIIYNHGKQVGWFGSDFTNRVELEKQCNTAVRTAYALGCPFKDDFTAKIGIIKENLPFKDNEK